MRSKEEDGPVPASGGQEGSRASRKARGLGPVPADVPLVQGGWARAAPAVACTCAAGMWTRGDLPTTLQHLAGHTPGSLGLKQDVAQHVPLLRCHPTQPFLPHILLLSAALAGWGRGSVA